MENVIFKRKFLIFQLTRSIIKKHIIPLQNYPIINELTQKHLQFFFEIITS